MNSVILKLLFGVFVLKFCTAQLSSPVNVTISDVQTEQFTVSWDSSNQLGSYVEHQINIQSRDDNDTVLTTNVTSLFSVDVTGLIPGATYTITVTAVHNDSLSSEPSTPTNQTTVPSAVVLREYAATTTSVTAQWQWSNDDGVADYFNVECGSGNATETTIDVSDETLYYATCTDVTPGRNVTIVVSSMSGNMISEDDTIIISAVPSAVVLSEYAATTTSVTAQWQWSRSDDGVADSFNVECGSGNATEATIDVSDETLYNATCTDVTPGRNVTITVSSMSGDKMSDNDTIIISAVPEIVESLTEIGATNDTITVGWTAPNGDVDFYNISCNAKSAIIYHVDGVNTYNASCINLVPGENYNISVVANSNGKEGEEAVVNIYTVPSEVVLREYAATTTSVTAQWQWSRSDDGVADNFNVECGSGNATEATIEVSDETLYNATCTDVTPGEDVLIAVSSMSGDKTSDNVTIIISAVPSEVVLREYATTTTSVTAQWQWSRSDDGVADNFNVECGSGNATEATIEVSDETLYNATCTDVTPGGDVLIAVSSMSGDKTSDNVTIIISAVPEIVRSLTEIGATNDTITVGWTAPNGEVDFYNISCNAKSEIIYHVDGVNTYNASCINLVPGENYNISVVANSNGKEGEEAVVNIYTVPSEVVLSEYAADTTSVTAQWQWSRSDDGVADHFNVECGSGNATETTIEVSDETLYNATCTDVTPGRNVTITVSSMSGDKTSDNVTIIISAVPEIAQSRAEIGATNDTITVGWTAPNGEVDFYSISCSGGKAEPERIDHVDGVNTYNASCINLVPGENYNVSVVANSNGKEGEEAVVNIYTIPSAVALNEDDATTTSVTTQWQWSSDDGVADLFIVNCGSGNSTDTTIEVTSQALYSATCMYVIPGRNVTIAVSSMSGDKISNNDTIIISAVPSSVQDLKEIIVTNETIVVSWEAPLGDVDYYVITCSGDVNRTDTVLHNYSDNMYNASCTKLTPGEEYEINVYANSNQKDGERESLKVVTTPNSVRLEEGPSTTNYVTARWRKPSGVFDSFNISCGEADTLPSFIPYSDTLGDIINASCINVTSGSTHNLTVTTVSGKETSLDTITLTALPSAVKLSELGANTTSVTTQWQWSSDNGVADHFNVKCRGDNPVDKTIGVTDETMYNATCSDVTPGRNVTIVVSSMSGDKTSENDTIIISAVPETVQYLSEVNATTESITVNWEAPEGDADFYQIICSGGLPDPDTIEHDSVQDLYSASCVDLPVAGADYEITVFATSNGKPGEHESINVTAVPNAVVLREYAASTTSVTTQWQWSDDDGVADHFNVECESGSAAEATIDVSDETLYNATCTDVTPGRNVTITVSSTSNDKTSENDMIIISAVPEIVQSLTEVDTTNVTVTIIWMKPVGDVELYKIYCPVEDQPKRIDHSEDNIYSAKCTDLTPGEDYTISVSANSNGKEGENSSVVVTAIPNSVKLKEGPSTTNNVTATWKKPFGEFDSFIISCRNADSSPDVIRPENIMEPTIQASCVNVDPGSRNTLKVTTVSNNESSFTSINLTALPEAVKNLSKIRATTVSITAKWESPPGVVDFYDITCSNNTTAEPKTVEADSDLRASCTGLTAGRSYDITVVADSNGKKGEEQLISIYARPEHPTNLILTFGMSYINATWTRPNGGFTEYKATLIKYDDDGDKVGLPMEKIVLDESVIFENVSPNTQYTVEVVTLNNEDVSDPVNETGETQEARPVPPVEMPPNPTDPTTHSFEVQLSKEFFDETNGTITNYTVIVSEETEKSKPIKDEDGILFNWRQARNNGKITPYQIFALKTYEFQNEDSSSERKRRQTENSNRVISITVGDSECKGKEEEYCNKFLEDNRKYVYSFYVCISGGRHCTNSKFSDPISTLKDNTLLIALTSSLGGVLIISIVVIVVIFRRRSQPIKSRTKTPYNNEAFPMIRESIKSKAHSRPVRLMAFADHFNVMKADSEYKFSEEYEDIREVGTNQAKDAAISPTNRTKNRFTNILPYDHTRVKLSPIDDEDGSDYINANYMPGYNSPREFIACQGPLPATEDDMWKLIWEQHVATIVMVTQLTERGRVKCHHYWPFDNNPTFYGDIMVTIEKENNFPDWTIREFKLECNHKTRHVRHFNYLAWPDHGVPESTDTILKFVNTVRRQIPKDGTPTLVHCSAGVGRTGTFICLDRLVQHMREHDYVDIFGIVCEMRMCRNLMVQTEKQYIFIHQCVLSIFHGSSRNTQQSDEVIYENGTRHKDIAF